MWYQLKAFQVRQLKALSKQSLQDSKLLTTHCMEAMQRILRSRVIVYDHVIVTFQLIAKQW